MTKINDGGPAFPLNASDNWGGPTQGMTLRDWFAGQALANRYTQDAREDKKVAQWAYHIADAMIAAREAGND